MELNYFNWIELFNNNFWKHIFKDKQFLNMHFDILNLTFGNLYIDILKRVYKDYNFSIPIKSILLVVIFDQTPIYGQSYTYGNIVYGQKSETLAPTKLSDIEIIYDNPIFPSIILKKNEDFEFKYDNIIFLNDKIKQISKYEIRSNNKPTSIGYVWGFNSILPTMNFAEYLHPELKNIYSDESIIYLIKYLRIGPAKQYFIRFLGSYFNVPYTYEDEKIMYISSTEIITDKNNYSIPENQNPIVEIGKKYEAYTFLTDGIIYNNFNYIKYIPLKIESHDIISFIYNSLVPIQIKNTNDIPDCDLFFLTEKFQQVKNNYPYKLAHLLDPTGFNPSKTYIPYISLQYKINPLKFIWDNFLKYNYMIFKIKPNDRRIDPLNILLKYKPLGKQLKFLIDYNLSDDKTQILDNLSGKQFAIGQFSDTINMEEGNKDLCSTDIFYV